MNTLSHRNDRLQAVGLRGSTRYIILFLYVLATYLELHLYHRESLRMTINPVRVDSVKPSTGTLIIVVHPVRSPNRPVVSTGDLTSFIMV